MCVEILIAIQCENLLRITMKPLSKGSIRIITICTLNFKESFIRSVQLTLFNILFNLINRKYPSHIYTIGTDLMELF